MRQGDSFIVLEKKVKDAYEARASGRDGWADWLYPYHVLVVAEKARALAERYGANAELSQAAALLHDIADTRMKRFDSEHEAASLRIAREFMQASGYAAKDTKLVVDDAIRLHSCPGGQRPASLEGKVLATADALAHGTTDYYIRTMRLFGSRGESLEHIKAWALKKNERDFHDKICFDDVRDEARPHYEAIKAFFSRSAHAVARPKEG